MSRLAVQIVNYRTLALLERCLASVAADLGSGDLSYEMNLLENASGEDLGPLSRRFEHCHLLLAPRNLGFGGGHNLLAQRTDASHLLILNPDVELVNPGSARGLLDVLLADPEVKVVGPKLLTADGRPQPYDHGRLRGVRAQISLRGGHSYWRATATAQDVAWVSGAAMLIERETFTALGGFDERFFLYKEDEDLCLRIRRAGGTIRYQPSVVVRHVGSVVAGRGEELDRATRLFFEKHFPHRRTRRAFAAVHRALPYVRL